MCLLSLQHCEELATRKRHRQSLFCIFSDVSSHVLSRLTAKAHARRIQQKRLLNRPSSRPTGQERIHVDGGAQSTRCEKIRPKLRTQKSISIRFEANDHTSKITVKQRRNSSCRNLRRSLHSSLACKTLTR